MARLPTVGGDENQWGDILNEFLTVSHREDGSLKNVPQVVNIKDFGAIGDGITDDTTAIQSAIDSLGEYQCLLFPVGEYLISSHLSFVNKKNILILGPGKIKSTADIVIFSLEICDNIIFKHLHVDGGQKDNSPSVSTGFQFVNCLWCVIDECSIWNVKKGVNCSGADSHEINIINSRLSADDVTTSVGIDLYGGDNYAVGNVIRGFDIGINICENSQQIMNNHIYGWPSNTFHHCLYINAHIDMIISGNFFDSPIDGAGVYLKDVYRINLINNFFLFAYDQPFIEFGGINASAWDIIIKNNIFTGLVSVTNPIKYPSTSYPSDSRRHYVRDNLFDTAYASLKATKAKKWATIPNDTSSVNVDFSDVLVGDVGEAFAIGNHPETSQIYIGMGGQVVTVYVPSNVTGDRSVQVIAYAKAERDS